MRRLKIGAIILSAALMVCGCNSPQGSIETTKPVETTTEPLTEKAYENVSETVNETTANTDATADIDLDKSFKNEYDITGGNIKYLAITDTNGKSQLFIEAIALDSDMATIMYAALVNVLKDVDSIDFTITSECSEGSLVYTKMDGKAFVGSMDKNENISTEIPEWYNTDLDIETGDYQLCFYDALNSLSKFMSDFTGTEYKPITPDNTNEANNIVYEDDYIRVEYNGVEKTRYNDGSYDIIVTVENLTDQSITVQAREMSINGYMVDPIYSCDIAAGKKSKEGMRISSSNAKDCPISDIENIETRFICYGSGFNSLEKTEPVVLYQK